MPAIFLAAVTTATWGTRKGKKKKKRGEKRKKARRKREEIFGKGLIFEVIWREMTYKIRE